MAIKVCELWHPQTGHWDTTEMQRLFGTHGAHIIQTVAKKPDVNLQLDDMLIWNVAKTSKYSVKEGYDCILKQSNEGDVQRQGNHWEMIAKLKGVVLKVKIFLWRLLSRVLLLGQNLHARIQSISPTCQRCLLENEFETHCLFSCPGSRAVWYGGKLGVREDELPVDIVQVFTQVTTDLNEEGLRIFAYTMWEVWKGRNGVVMRQEAFDPQQIWRRVDVWMEGSISTLEEGLIERPDNLFGGYVVGNGELQVFTDGSWDTRGLAGTAFVTYWEGVATTWAYNNHTAQDPFQEEAIAMLEAVRMLKTRIEEGTCCRACVHSDCLNLITALTEENTEDLPSWRSVPAVHQASGILGNLRGRVRINHIDKRANTAAHVVANYARRRADAMLERNVDSTFLEDLGIQPGLDSNIFVEFFV